MMLLCLVQMSQSSSDALVAKSALGDWETMLASASEVGQEAIARCIGANEKWECPAALPICPPKFGIKLAWRATELKYKKDPEQRLTFLVRLAEAAEQLLGSEKWSKSLAAEMSEWWSDHLNDKAVKVACAMFLHPLWTGANVKKAQCVEELVTVQVPVLPLHVLVSWLEQTQVTGRPTPNGAGGPAPRSVPNVTPASGVPAGGGPVPTANVQPQVEGVDAGHEAPAGLLVIDDTVQKVLAALAQAVNGVVPAVKAPTTGTILSGYEAWEDARITTIVSLGYIDCHMLSAMNREAMRRKKHGRNQARTVALGNGLNFTGADDDEPNFNDDYDPTSFKSGLSFYINTLSQHASVKDRVPDVLAWSMLIEEQKASERSKVAYMREFMYKYRGVAGASDWVGKVNTDNLLRSFLYQEPPGGYKRPLQPDGGSGYVWAKRGKGGAGRGHVASQPGRASGRGPGVGVNIPIAQRFCFSRLSLTRVCAGKGQCRFLHECATCRADHAASACPVWDAAKVSAIIAADKYKV